MVVDANVLTHSLCLDDERGHAARRALGRDGRWGGPDHVRLEAANAVRGLTMGGKVPVHTADEAIVALGALQITLVPTALLLGRIWQLRHNLTAYDAAYVAAAELLDADLLTADRRMAAAPGTFCRFVHP